MNAVLPADLMQLAITHSTAPVQDGRPLLCIAVGTRGMVPLRALLSWTPMLAHATANKVCMAVHEMQAEVSCPVFLAHTRPLLRPGVRSCLNSTQANHLSYPPPNSCLLCTWSTPQVSCLYVTRSPTSAVFLTEWDKWREAGVGGAGRC